jgi:hypothetical protein
MEIKSYISDFRDEVRVHPFEEYEVNFWSEKLNVSPGDILQAIRATQSDKLNEILKYLGKDYHAFRP